MNEAADIYAIVSKYGFGGLMTFIVVGSYFDLWCWSRDRKKAETECSFWRDRYLETFDVARHAVRAIPSSRTVGA